MEFTVEYFRRKVADYTLNTACLKHKCRILNLRCAVVYAWSPDALMYYCWAKLNTNKRAFLNDRSDRGIM